MLSRGCWDAPGAVEEGVAQRGEDGDFVRPGGGDVGTDAAEGLEPAHAPPAPADRARPRIELRLLAYNGEAWLAEHFNAYLADPDEHRAPPAPPRWPGRLPARRHH